MINPSVPMVNQGVRDSSQLMADDYARPEGQNIMIEYGANTYEEAVYGAGSEDYQVRG